MNVIKIMLSSILVMTYTLAHCAEKEPTLKLEFTKLAKRTVQSATRNLGVIPAERRAKAEQEIELFNGLIRQLESPNFEKSKIDASSEAAGVNSIPTIIDLVSQPGFTRANLIEYCLEEKDFSALVIWNSFENRHPSLEQYYIPLSNKDVKSLFPSLYPSNKSFDTSIVTRIPMDTSDRFSSGYYIATQNLIASCITSDGNEYYNFLVDYIRNNIDDPKDIEFISFCTGRIASLKKNERRKKFMSFLKDLPRSERTE